MTRFLKRKRNKYDWIAYSCYAFMILVMLGEGYWNHARAGDIQWSIQLNFPITGHGYSGPATGNIGTPPHQWRPHHNHYPRNHYHHHPHFYDGRYGHHHHQGHRYVVVHEFQNYQRELCREFQMEVNIYGQRELAWGVACRDYRGYWRLTQ